MDDITTWVVAYLWAAYVLGFVMIRIQKRDEPYVFEGIDGMIAAGFCWFMSPIIVPLWIIGRAITGW